MYIMYKYIYIYIYYYCMYGKNKLPTGLLNIAQPWVIQVIIPARNARTARRPEFTWVPPHCDTVVTVS